MEIEQRIRELERRIERFEAEQKRESPSTYPTQKELRLLFSHSGDLDPGVILTLAGVPAWSGTIPDLYGAIEETPTDPYMIIERRNLQLDKFIEAVLRYLRQRCFGTFLGPPESGAEPGPAPAPTQ